MRKYDISVVMPVFKCEQYLREAVDSVIHQTLGFRRIQMILVDDGSPDNSGAICDEYAARYPENIIVIHKTNGGVSSARNEGIRHIQGTFVNFMDSDDKWEPHSFQNLFRAMKKAGDSVDVAAARIKFFDKQTVFHPLDYKFARGTRIARVDDPDELYSIQSTVATALIRASAIGELRFDSNLKYGEDSVFVNKIILKKRAYALVSEALYYYRKRDESASAVDEQIYHREYYIESLSRYHLELDRYSRELCGTVIPYVQAVHAYDFGWRENIPSKTIHTALNDEEYLQYCDLRENLLTGIDDSIILSNPVHNSLRNKACMLYHKCGDKLFENLVLEPDKNTLCYHDIPVVDFTDDGFSCVILDQISFEDNGITLDGRIDIWFVRELGFSLWFSCEGIDADVTLSPYKHIKSPLFDEQAETLARYVCHIPMDKPVPNGKKITIRPVLRKKGYEHTVPIRAGGFLPDCIRFPGAFRFIDNYYLRVFSSGVKIRRTDRPGLWRPWLEIKWCYWALKTYRPGLIQKRLFYQLKKIQTGKKKIWLISDRPDNAGDNGEVFFKYAVKHCPPDVEPIFAIGKNAECVPRLKKEGKTVFFEDKDYLYDFLVADKVISSGASAVTVNPWRSKQKYFIDLYKENYYYLQHGVACADLSSWLNRNSKNLHMIFTSANVEEKSFNPTEYFYSPEQIRLTGMARFDELVNGDKKQLLILPTWRRSIKESYDERTTQSIYYDGFRNTDFFKFYNGLINDERLLSVMRQHGFKGLFCLHPIQKKQWVDFKGNDVFSINEGFVDYNKVFEESSLMVTDYSSVLFDFAYLRKSVLYTQFDRDEFFEGQIYDQGYFDYERDGFGPVCYDFESAVRTLIECVERDCAPLPEYLARQNAFFAYSDRNNCQRIYDVIIHDGE